MSAKRDSNVTRPEEQPSAEIEAYAAKVTGDLARLIIPQAGQLVTRSTDSPASNTGSRWAS